MIEDIHKLLWVDPKTRAVFLEFLVYSKDDDLFANIRLAMEFVPGRNPYHYFYTIFVFTCLHDIRVHFVGHDFHTLLFPFVILLGRKVPVCKLKI